jgi:hypothetical protein
MFYFLTCTSLRSLRDLVSLETLDLRKCDAAAIPVGDLCALENLKLLDLRCASKLSRRSKPGDYSFLPKLAEIPGLQGMRLARLGQIPDVCMHRYRSGEEPRPTSLEELSSVLAEATSDAPFLVHVNALLRALDAKGWAVGKLMEMFNASDAPFIPGSTDYSIHYDTLFYEA